MFAALTSNDEKAGTPVTKNTDKGAAVYSPLTLKLYDAWVLGVSNRYAWKCKTRQVLLPFFQKNLSARHLDIGVGTGYYLAKARLETGSRVTLMDLNASSLCAAQGRLKHLAVHTIQHDVMTALPSQFEGGFDSISMFYLLHCLPGNFADKGKTFAHLKSALSKHGVLYGATILGESVEHNGFGRTLMQLYNRKGIFGNQRDDLEGLREQLQQHFAQVQIRLEGKVALFEARQPIV